VCQSVRPAFECPGCGRNAFKLFYRDGWFSGCHRCIGVPYASQQRSRKGRSRFVNRLQKLEVQAHSRRRRKPITKQLSYKLLRPITAYNLQRHAIV
jgi:hypothetical protein